jgi:hypothetical protein
LKSQSGDYEAFKNDIDKSIVYGIEQNYKLLNDKNFIEELLKKGKCNNNYYPKRFITLIVSPESHWNVTIPPFDKYLINKITPLQSKYGIESNSLSFLISIEGIIRLFEWNKIDGKDISKILLDYNKYLMNPNKSNNLGSSGFPKSLDEFIKIKTTSLNTKHTLAKEIYNEFLNKISAEILNVV